DNSSIIAFSSNPVLTTENKNYRHNHSNIIIGDSKYCFLNEKTNIKKTAPSYKNKKKPPTKLKKDGTNSKEITIVPIGNNDK
ncbi:serine/threonine-protein phosphatase, partial [Cronobacter sakazakii]|nr:serine/threonine-protein phosphatase [Cronobacter sakazakii]ELY5834621.1 serine/threonine-protein phosphatase [Cronobacter sakazakii]